MKKQTEPYLDFKTQEMVCPWCTKREKLLLPMSVSEASRTMFTFARQHDECERIDKRKEVPNGV